MSVLAVMLLMVGGAILALMLVADPKLRNWLTPGLGDGMAGPKPAPGDPPASPIENLKPHSVVPVMDVKHPGLARGPVCPACRSNLMVGVPVFRALVPEFNRELSELERVAETGPELLEWVRRQPVRDPGADPHVVVEFQLCHTCQTGWLVIRFMVPGWAGFTEDLSQQQVLALPPSVTEAFTQ